jgi:bis(5'-adenosyl)-triphosphatase
MLTFKQIQIVLSFDMTCPFCSPDIVNASFAESENFRAIYNLAPVLPGHVLVIPKTHIVGFLDISKELTIEMVLFSRKIIRTLQKAFTCESFDWTIQDGKPAGQTIEHMHLHIIPLYENDLPEPGGWYPAVIKSTDEFIDSLSRSKISEAQMKIIVDKLKNYYSELQD